MNLRPNFSSPITDYRVTVSTADATIGVTASPQDSTTAMTIDGQSTASGQRRTISLGSPGESKSIFIRLTAQSGSQTTYVVTVTRPASSNNDLRSLTISPGTLDPVFTASATNYSVEVGSGVASVNVTAMLQDAAASMTINGQGANSGQARSISLSPAGSNTPILIIVTAPSGTQKTYTVIVRRAALGGNNNLQSLTVAPGTLKPAFTAATTNYTVDVAGTVASLTITPRLQDPAATMTVNGQPTTSGQARTIPLNGAGSITPVNILVTAPNGTQKTYLITVNREALSANNNLSALHVTPGTLTPAFAPDQLTYTVDVATGVSSLTVTATLQDPNASLTINGQGTGSGQAREITPLEPPGSNTLITMLVRAPSGAEKTYTLTVKRPLPSSDAALSALTLSAGALNPGFAAGTLTYTVTVPAGVDSLTVTATKSDPNAVMSASGAVIAPAGVATGSVSRPLGLGTTTTITITVIAQDGVHTTPYTINAFRDSR